MMISEKVLDAVISHQFSSANEALATNKSVELSGFGKLVFNKKKAERKIAKWEGMIGSLEKHAVVDERKIGFLKENIEELKRKINEPVTNLRGLEEQVDSPISSEGDY